MVTDTEFKQALANKDNIKIINEVVSQYKRFIPKDELYTCGLEALWRCLGYHQDGKGNKFTTSLWTFTNWECLRKLKKLNNYKKRFKLCGINPNLSYKINELSEHVNDCLNSLPNNYGELLRKYYIDKCTLEEISNTYGYKKNTVSRKIKMAIDEFKKRCILT